MATNKSTMTFADVFDLQMGKTPSRDIPSYWSGDNVWVSIADMKDRKYVDSSKETISDEAVKATGIREVQEGTVFMSFKLSIGKVAIAAKSLYTNEAIMQFPIKPGYELSPEYLYYYLLGHKWQGANKAVMGATLNKKKIAQELITFPSIEEQQRIVDELDLLTGIIDKKNAQLRDLDALAQSIFYEMFGDPVTNEKGWTKKMLKELGQVITGNTPSTKDVKNYATEDVCFFKPSDIGKDSVTSLHNSEYHISSYAFESSRKLPAGSVLTTCIGIVGKVGILTKEATCNQQINAIIPEKVDSLYLAYAILSKKDLLEKMANAPVVPIINKGDFSKIIIAIPPLDLQHAFAAKIEALEQQKTLIKKSLQETETLLASRMDHYFGD